MLEQMSNAGDLRDNSHGDRPDQNDEEKALIKKTMDTFYRFKRYRKRYDKRWMDYYRLVRGQQWDYRRPKWKNSEIVNFIFSTIQAQIPLQTDVRPRFSYLPREPSDREFAAILDSIAEADYEEQNWLRTVFEVLYDGWIYGTSYAGMEYDQEENYGMGSAVFKSKDPFFCYPHPDANEINDNESDIFFYASPVDTTKVKRAFPEKAQYIKKDTFDRVKKDRTETNSFNMTYFNSDRQLAEGSYGESQGSADDIDRTMVIEAYMKPRDVEEFEESDDSGEDRNEASDKKKFTVKSKYPNGRFIVIANNMILHDGPLPYEDSLIPFAKYNNYILPREFFGMSECEQLESPQIVFNKMLGFVLDGFALTGNPIWIIDSNSEVDPDNLANRPGSVVEKNPGSEVRREAGVTINPTFYAMLDRLVGWFNDVSGQGEFSQGKAEGGVTAASAIEQLISASRTRIRQKQRNLDGFMKEAGVLYMNRVFQYYTVPKIFRITNKDGSQMFRKFRIERTKNPEGEEQKEAVFSDFEDDTRGGMVEGKEKRLILKGNLDVRVTTGSELPFDVADNERKALALFDRGILDPEEVLNRIEYPNKEKVLQRLADREQAAAQQAAQQGVQ